MKQGLIQELYCSIVVLQGSTHMTIQTALLATQTIDACW